MRRPWHRRQGICLALRRDDRLTCHPDGRLVAGRRIGVMAVPVLALRQVIERRVAMLPGARWLRARGDEALDRPRGRLAVGEPPASQSEPAVAFLIAPQVGDAM